MAAGGRTADDRLPGGYQCLSLSLSLSISTYLSIYTPTYPSIQPAIHPSIPVPSCLSGGREPGAQARRLARSARDPRAAPAPRGGGGADDD